MARRKKTHVDPVLSMWGQLAAHESWAQTKDRAARTAPARAGLEARFLREADGDPARAESIRKAYFARLALASLLARQARKAARGGAAS